MANSIETTRKIFRDLERRSLALVQGDHIPESKAKLTSKTGRGNSPSSRSGGKEGGQEGGGCRNEQKKGLNMVCV